MVLAISLHHHLIAFLLMILLGVAATDQAGMAYLDEKSKLANVIMLMSGLQYKVLRKGEGAFHLKTSSPCLCYTMPGLSLMVPNLTLPTCTVLPPPLLQTKSSKSKVFSFFLISDTSTWLHPNRRETS
jgi:hypothetical protein